MPRMSQNKKTFELMASRGCPFSCGFCSRVSGKKVFHRSVQRVIEDIALLKKEYGVEEFWFLDESFTVDREWVEQFCYSVIEKSLGIAFTCSTRVNLIDKHILALLKKAGCISVSFGLESYNQDVLDSMKKGITLAQVDAALRACLEADIQPLITYMIGYPGETLKSIYDTVEFVFLSSRGKFVNDYFVPLPGSDIYDELRAQGKITDEDTYLQNLPEHFDRPYINVTDLKNLELEIFPQLVFKKLQQRKTS